MLGSLPGMSTMNISLPEELKAFVDQQVAGRGYASSSEYLRELIRKEQDREKLRGLLLEGLNSGPGRVADAAYFEELRQRVLDRAATKSVGGKPVGSR
jgi:antitoxin ParD1/3/4